MTNNKKMNNLKVTRLKTLKDIEKLNPTLTWKNALNKTRQEAIKWIKIEDESKGIYLEKDDWMKFFNITEDDLKVVKDLK